MFFCYHMGLKGAMQRCRLQPHHFGPICRQYFLLGIEKENTLSALKELLKYDLSMEGFGQLNIYWYQDISM